MQMYSLQISSLSVYVNNHSSVDTHTYISVYVWNVVSQTGYISMSMYLTTIVKSSFSRQSFALFSQFDSTSLTLIRDTHSILVSRRF